MNFTIKWAYRPMIYKIMAYGLYNKELALSNYLYDTDINKKKINNSSVDSVLHLEGLPKK